MSRFLLITIFLLTLKPSELLPQSLEKMFCGTVADISIRWSFNSHNSFHCAAGSHLYEGVYKFTGDTILVVSCYDHLRHQNDSSILKDKFIIDSVGCLVSIRSRFAFRPIRSIESYFCVPVGTRYIKYPQVNTQDTVLKSLVWQMLAETFGNKKFTDLFPRDSHTISVSNYFFLNNSSQPVLTVKNRSFSFKQGMAFIQIEDVNVNEDMVTFHFLLDKKSKGGMARFVCNGGLWELEWINTWVIGKP
jgi:hypothetical protein